MVYYRPQIERPDIVRTDHSRRTRRNIMYGWQKGEQLWTVPMNDNMSDMGFWLTGTLTYDRYPRPPWPPRPPCMTSWWVLYQHTDKSSVRAANPGWPDLEYALRDYEIGDLIVTNPCAVGTNEWVPEIGDKFYVIADHNYIVWTGSDWAVFEESPPWNHEVEISVFASGVRANTRFGHTTVTDAFCIPQSCLFSTNRDLPSDSMGLRTPVKVFKNDTIVAYSSWSVEGFGYMSLVPDEIEKGGIYFRPSDVISFLCESYLQRTSFTILAKSIGHDVQKAIDVSGLSYGPIYQDGVLTTYQPLVFSSSNTQITPGYDNLLAITSDGVNPIIDIQDAWFSVTATFNISASGEYLISMQADDAGRYRIDEEFDYQSSQGFVNPVIRPMYLSKGEHAVELGLLNAFAGSPMWINFEIFRNWN